MPVRRSPPAHPPAGTALGSETIRAPLPVERGLVHGTSNPANERSLQPYEDSADVPKPNHPAPAAKTPFALEGW